MKREYVALFSAISTSETLADLPDDTSRLFYTWALGQADAWGRMSAKPRVLAAEVWPLLGKTIAQTEKALSACIAAGLLLRLTKAETVWIQIPDWEEKAGRLIPPSRRAKYSRWPSQEEADPSSTPPPEKKREEKRRDPPEAGGRSTQDYSGVFLTVPELDTDSVRVAMEEYFSYRRKKRWDKLLPESVEATLRELRQYGPDGAAAGFRQSIRQGWKGVFAPKGENGHAGGQTEFVNEGLENLKQLIREEGSSQ
jgi:hypothetical protein